LRNQVAELQTQVRTLKTESAEWKRKATGRGEKIITLANECRGLETDLASIVTTEEARTLLRFMTSDESEEICDAPEPCWSASKSITQGNPGDEFFMWWDEYVAPWGEE